MNLGLGGEALALDAAQLVRIDDDDFTMTNDKRQRWGLSIIEVLVILLIAGVVVGVLLVFIYQSRQAAARVACANNLRLLGEGIYHVRGKVSRKDLEKGVAGAPLPAARIAPGYGTWAVQLAQYLEPVGALKEWDMRKSYFEQPAAVRQSVSSLFLCPERNRPQPLSISGDVEKVKAGNVSGNVAGAVGDYACASGNGDPRFPYDGDKANGAIVLGRVLEKRGDLVLRWQSRTEFSSLVRGLSNTILLGEKHVPQDGFGRAEEGDGSLYNGANPASFARVGGPGFPLARSAADPFNTNFGSYHPGICNFLMADDSVRPIANDISAEILGRLIRRD